jgi:hypothetical protein
MLWRLLHWPVSAIEAVVNGRSGSLSALRPAFGKIVGYMLVTEAATRCDLGLPFDVEGGPIGPYAQSDA